MSKQQKSMRFILTHGFVQRLQEPLAHSAGSCEAGGGWSK